MKRALAGLLFVSCATTPAVRPAPVPVTEASTPAPPALTPLPQTPPMALVVKPSPGTPIVSVRLVFRVGSADDPKGKEGLTALTTRLLLEGGTRTLSAAALDDALFPMAAQLKGDTDKQFTVVTGRVHRERFVRFLELLAEALLEPGLDPKEFERLKAEQLNAIRNRLRSESDEELGKVMLDALLYEGHPYAHAVVGTESGLGAITLDDVRAHWRACFTKARLVVGVGGAADEAVGEQVREALAALPESGAPAAVIPPAPSVTNQTLIVKRDTASTAGSFGVSWAMRRDHPDFPLVFLGLSYLGEHRQEHGVLFRELRDRRGLNYGTYAYAEHYRQEGWSSIPRTNIARTVQDLTLWLRPVEAAHGPFATGALLYFLNDTLTRPLPAERFEIAKGFLAGATRIWTQTDQRRLGWAIDELLYGTPDFLERVRAVAATATPEQVQGALRRHLAPQALNFVFVTKDVDGLRRALTSGEARSITYPTPKPKEVLEQDVALGRFPLPMREGQVRALNASEVMR